MASAGDISIIYADNPWGDLSMLERYPTYVPNLLANYRRAAKWSRFVRAQIDFLAMRTRSMVLSRQIDGEPNYDPKSAKTLFFPVSTFASLQRKLISLEYHYASIAWHEDDNLFNYLDVSLDSWCRGQLGWDMGLYFDYLYRNCAMTSAYTRYGALDNKTTKFAGLTSADDIFDILWIPEILLGMEYEDIVDSETGMPSVACLTTPGVIFDIKMRDDGEWRALNSFTEEGRAALMTYGIVGTYHGVGFIPSRANVLWCCGPITAQIGIVEPMNTLDGVKDEEDMMGWNSAQSGIKQYVQLHSSGETGAITDIVAGDVVMLHRQRGNTYGVSNGVLPTDGMSDMRVVREVDNANHRIVLDRPWLKDGYTTAVEGGSYYGFVTKAQHVHMSSFLGDAGAIQLGVAQPPMVKEAPAIDNMLKLHRISWDAHVRPLLMNHGGVRNVFTRGAFVAPNYGLMTYSR